MPRYLNKHPFPFDLDLRSGKGARVLAEYIMEYWAKRGHGTVVATPEKFPGTVFFAVKSNLVGGLPPARVKKGPVVGAAVQAERTAAELAEREFLR
jgi:hypothetical protein